MELHNILIIFTACIALLVVGACVDDERMVLDVDEDNVVPDISEESSMDLLPEGGVLGEVSDNQEAGPIVIGVSRMAFDQGNIVVPFGSVVTWKNIDDRVHKIVCYIGTGAVDREMELLTPQLKAGEEFSHVFVKSGAYECRDVVFGYWGNLIVLPDDTPTGLVVGMVDYSADNPLEIMLVAIVVVVFSIYGYQVIRKKS